MTRGLISRATAAYVSAAVLAGVLGAGASAFAQEIGRLAAPLDGARNAVAETNLGDLVADATRAAIATEPGDQGADFAFIQASALQPGLEPADGVTADLARRILVLPDETVAVLQLSSGQIKECLERSLALLPYPNKGFLQVSGLKLRFDAARPPGDRVVSIVTAPGPAGGGASAPLAAGRLYRVAMPESLAAGGLGYFRIFNSAPRQRTEITLSQALSRFIAANSPVLARVEGRIQTGK
jgi:2',3'-cyclic-nucleotide 2'-phosphodiesterase (5'-nucleotidase family)